MKILLLNQTFYPDVVSTAQHLADLATDELMEMTNIDDERAKKLITAARAHWFTEEEQQ